MIEELWDLSEKENEYAALPDLMSEFMHLASTGKLTFRSVSVGGPNGQVAIIPLDESSIERGRLIAYAPEMARMLLRVWRDDFDREELEKFLIKIGAL